MKRTQEHELEIRAPASDVWEALVDPEGLTRWFVEEARVEPGEGGRIWGSWGEGMDGETRIGVWEPPRRLRLVDHFGGALDEPMFEEYVLETRGGATLLRLVHGDIPDSPDWDGFYDSTTRGWMLFLRNLRHYLEQHPGEPRRSRYTVVALEGSAAAAWRSALDALGLGGASPTAGERFAATTPDGDRLEGDVVTCEPERALQLTLEPFDRGLLTLGIETSHVWATVATFGDREVEAADLLAQRLRHAFDSGANAT